MSELTVIDEKKLEEIRKNLLSSNRPLFLFDDDPDGLCSFLMLYRFVKNGNGWPLKGSAVDEKIAEKVNNYQPDLVVILDKAIVRDEFFDNVSAKIIWIDHHEPVEIKNKNITYLNPRVFDDEDNSATSYCCYRIVNQDLWLATIGMIGDWQMISDEMFEEFVNEYPSLLNSKDIKVALFENEIGKLIKIFSFNLKGKSEDVISSIKILSRVENPLQILNGESAQTRLLLKRFEKHNLAYENLLNRVGEPSEEKLFVFTYNSNENSYTTYLSNELLQKYPNKIVIVARQSGDSYKCSLRSENIAIAPILEKVLSQINGEGGGHANACGAVIKTEQFESFLDLFREELKNYE